MPPDSVASAAGCLSLLLAQGSRVTVYRRCTHEIFAPYGECARWDGLVERVTRFANDDRQVVEEVSLLRGDPCVLVAGPKH